MDIVKKTYLPRNQVESLVRFLKKGSSLTGKGIPQKKDYDSFDKDEREISKSLGQARIGKRIKPLSFKL